MVGDVWGAAPVSTQEMPGAVSSEVARDLRGGKMLPCSVGKHRPYSFTCVEAILMKLR